MPYSVVMYVIDLYRFSRYKTEVNQISLYLCTWVVKNFRAKLFEKIITKKDCNYAPD